MGSQANQPGLGGVVPFRFECQRSGRCCSVPGGVVWLEEGEAERMAERQGVDPADFREQQLRTLPDPVSGELREALREDPGTGRCVLLEGQNHCRVYDTRPQHCARFPFWPRVLAEPEAFERARALCPGITAEPSPEVRARALEALRSLYEEVDAFVERASPVCIVRGVCCRFEEADHSLFATGLEADYAVQLHPVAPRPEAAGRCPYHVGGRCTAREGRPLGCRTYFCEERNRSVLEEAHEHFLGKLRALERRFGYPSAYAPFPELLEARGVGSGAEEARETPS